MLHRSSRLTNFTAYPSAIYQNFLLTRLLTVSKANISQKMRDQQESEMDFGKNCSNTNQENGEYGSKVTDAGVITPRPRQNELSIRKSSDSYWYQEGSEPLKNWTVADLLRQSVKKFENRKAICSYRGSRLTFEQAYERIENFAVGLICLGLEKGDHVGIWAPSIIEWYISILAIMKAGFVAVNLNPLFECPEVESSLKKMDVKCVIIGDKLNDRNFYQMIERIVPNISNYKSNEMINCDHLPYLKFIIAIVSTPLRGTYRWNDIIQLGNNNDSHSHRQTLLKFEKQIHVHDTCNIQSTSGTTGTSKGATLSHYNIVNNSYFISKRMELSEKHHVICLQVPLFHTFGTVLGILVSLHSGATLILPSMKFSPTSSIEAIVEERCSVVYGTPTMYTDLITVAEKLAEKDPSIYSKLACMEIALTSGAHCTPELFRKMRKTFSFKHIHTAYGMTEVSPVAFLTQPGDDESVVTRTVGSVLDHTEIKVIGKDGRVVPFGVPGEVCFKGYLVMKGYYNDPQKTEQSFLEGGWIRSGDRFVLLENGYGQFIGRIKDTINRGGENIEPTEIEMVLMNHPDIISVQVFGVSDDRLGEVVAASIVKKENSLLDENMIRLYCRGKLAAYKIPKYVEFVRDYPRTATGKVQKSRLREKMERDLNLK